MAERRVTRGMTKRVKEFHKLVFNNHLDFMKAMDEFSIEEFPLIKELEFTDKSLDIHKILYEITHNCKELQILRLPESCGTTFIHFNRFGQMNQTVTRVFKGYMLVYVKGHYY